jgi:hypothetical protein
MPMFFKIEKTLGVSLDKIQFAGTCIPIEITPYYNDSSPVLCYPYKICTTKINSICWNSEVSSIFETNCISAKYESNCSENYQLLTNINFTKLSPFEEEIQISNECEYPEKIKRKYLNPIRNISISVTGIVSGITLTGISNTFDLYPLESKLILKGEHFNIAEEVLIRMPNEISWCDGIELVPLSMNLNFKNYINEIFDKDRSYYIYENILNFFDNHRNPDTMNINALMDISNQLNIPIIDNGISDGPPEIEKLLQVYSMNPTTVFGYENSWDLNERENVGDIILENISLTAGNKIWIKNYRSDNMQIFHLPQISGQNVYDLKTLKQNIMSIAPYFFDTISLCFPPDVCFFKHIKTKELFPRKGLIDWEKNELYIEENNWEEIGEVLFASELTKGLFPNLSSCE